MKTVKFLKKFLSLTLVLFLCIESFGAIVSDNDGSAFITKAEFDSLKNDFQAQIDAYNSSIDSKIDEAIASYLSGIRVETTTQLVNKLDRINAASLDGYMSGETFVPYGFRCMAKRFNPPATQKPVGVILNFMIINSQIVANQNNTRAIAIARIGVDHESRAQFIDKIRPNSASYKKGKYLICKKTNNGFSLLNKFSDVEYRYWVGGSLVGTYVSVREPRTANQASTFQWCLDGELEFVNNNDYWSINLKSFDQCWGPPGDQRGTMTIGTAYGPAYSAIDTNIVVPIVGAISGSSICIVNDDFPSMILDDEAYIDEFDGFQSLLRDVRASNNMDSPLVRNNLWTGTNQYGHVKLRYNHHRVDEKALNTIFDDAVYESLNEEVTLYNGLPLFTSTDNGKVKFKIKFYNLSNNNVYIGLSKNKFNNDASAYVIDSSLNLRKEDGTLYNTHIFESNREYTFVVDVEKNQTVWLKTYDPTLEYEFTGATITSDIELTMGS